eukprot:Plantae.Rhodophyta-Purpureofilum_apyrenoidigerum.ctg2114.p1 GENE.Plantae.Rhodophyta-Purpureofilum_apyrenoidigerum.ctg2114~~Plantae.Rhodophyta-Purpureofilum_apyrenoidigerum.ctg2114.p1  ORF type:complete len:1354 (+),score=138.93 Plantae.Rhodophyta-Purpureofilum_apyrenoidigerum.ctg2114:538-4599(+)
MGNQPHSGGMLSTFRDQNDAKHHAHDNCINWRKELCESDDAKNKYFDALADALSAKCMFCRKRGASVRCWSKNCENAYHFTCGVDKDAHFTVCQSTPRSYCPLHATKSIQKHHRRFISKNMTCERGTCSICEGVRYCLELGPLLKCKVCRVLQHSSCLSPPLKTTAVLDEWTCSSCDRCGTCAELLKSQKLLRCAGCERPFHSSCLSESMNESRKLTGVLLCDLCFRCSHCEKFLESRDNRNSLICEECKSLYIEENFCTVCDQVYKEEDTEMIECEGCNRWIHAHCAGVDNVQLEALSGDASWSCCSCKTDGVKPTRRGLAKRVQQCKKNGITRLSLQRIQELQGKNRPTTATTGLHQAKDWSKHSVRGEIPSKAHRNLHRIASNSEGFSAKELFEPRSVPGLNRKTSKVSETTQILLETRQSRRVRLKKQSLKSAAEVGTKRKLINAERQELHETKQLSSRKRKVSGIISDADWRYSDKSFEAAECSNIDISGNQTADSQNAKELAQLYQVPNLNLHATLLSRGFELSFNEASVSSKLAGNRDLCYICGATGTVADLRFCVRCGEAEHTYCGSPITMATLVQRYSYEGPKRFVHTSTGILNKGVLDWLCRRCVLCEICHNRDALETAATPQMCEFCQKGYHEQCLSDMGKKFSANAVCPTCSTCSLCHISPATSDISGMQCCAQCKTIAKDMRDCSECTKPPDAMKVIMCTACKSLVHEQCWRRQSQHGDTSPKFPPLVYVCRHCKASAGQSKHVRKTLGSDIIAEDNHEKESTWRASLDGIDRHVKLSVTASKDVQREDDKLGRNDGWKTSQESNNNTLLFEFEIEPEPLSTWGLDICGELVCELCRQATQNETVGRFIPIDQLGWVHVNCVVWSSEVCRSDKSVDVLNNVKHAVKRNRNSYRCSLCGDKGATVGCEVRTCKENYHFPCAVQAECQFGATVDSYHYVRCKRHASNQSAGLFTTEPKERLLADYEEEVPFSSSPGPFRVGALTCVDIGRVVCEDAAFHDMDAIYPVGYRAYRMYFNPWNPLKRSLYYFSIHGDLESGPLFCIRCPDDPNFDILATSAEDAWSQVVARQTRLRAQERLDIHESWRSEKISASPTKAEALVAFGLATYRVLSTVERMPDSWNCVNHRFITYPPRALTTSYESMSCARVLGHINRHKAQRSSLHAVEQVEVESKSNKDDGSKKEILLDNVALLHAKMIRKWKAKTVIRRSGIQGLGLFALDYYKPGEIVIEYCGETIRPELSDGREAYYDSRGIGCYMFRVDARTIIDATMTGNYARFINHSCDPNCYSRTVSVGGRRAIVIIAKQEIKPQEEFTYDYLFNLDEEPEKKIPCHCGAAKCKLFLN